MAPGSRVGYGLRAPKIRGDEDETKDGFEGPRICMGGEWWALGGKGREGKGRRGKGEGRGGGEAERERTYGNELGL